ncbi:helix-turn-helix domain-containing protein [Pseudomonas viridiflava]|uniref:helix-turn-helix domain-containing protein n=1 Tax=Pseudomonas viridiflava TaxID=33069 RepID=UPI002468A37B|nr:helix-turn-helix domain-containing protein [Pseudomonas viridiflava]
MNSAEKVRRYWSSDTSIWRYSRLNECPESLDHYKNRQAVLEFKAQGKTQAEIVRLLGLSRSSVQRYWNAQPLDREPT